MGAEYAPESRRPIAGVFRMTARWTVDRCVARGIHPDAISYASMVAAAVAAACYWQSGRWPILLLIAPLPAYIRLWLNMLDGMVAVAADKASRRGEILNDLPDRVSDVIIFVSVAHSGLAHLAAGYWAAIMAVVTAYVGLFGQAVGAGRQFGGLMAKPWRMVTLHLGAWVTLGFAWAGHGEARALGLTVLDWTLLVIVAGCLQTIWVRLAAIMRGLRDDTE